MIVLNKILKGGKKKRLMGIATKEEAQEAFDNYYKKQKSYLGQIFDMRYMKDEEHTLTTCDDPEFKKCREKEPNTDGKGNTCLEVAERVCPKESLGSAKYTRTRLGPKRFDIAGIDSFEEGAEIKHKGKVVISLGLPKSKDGRLNKDIAKAQYKKRRKDGLPDIVNLKKKRETCKMYRKTKGKKCDDVKECVWVKSVGCRKKKDKKELREEKKELIKELEISDDEPEEVEEEGELVTDSIEFKYLKGMKNSAKFPKNKKDEVYCFNYDAETGTINAILYNEVTETTNIIGKLNVLIEIDMEIFNESENLEHFILNNNNLLEFIPNQTGGSIRISLYVNTSTGMIYDINENGTMIGNFKNGVIRFI